MVGMDSFSSSAGGISVATSGMRFLRTRGCHALGGMNGLGCPCCRLFGGFRCCCGRLFGRTSQARGSLGRRGFALDRIPSPAGGPLDCRSGRQDRRLPVDLQMSDLLLDLRLEIVGGAAELVHELADLAGDLRQLLGPEDNQGQKEQEDRLRETHALHHTAPEGKAAILWVSSSWISCVLNSNSLSDLQNPLRPLRLCSFTSEAVGFRGRKRSQAQVAEALEGRLCPPRKSVSFFLPHPRT